MYQYSEACNVEGDTMCGSWTNETQIHQNPAWSTSSLSSTCLQLLS